MKAKRAPRSLPSLNELRDKVEADERPKKVDWRALERRLTKAQIKAFWLAQRARQSQRRTRDS